MTHASLKVSGDGSVCGCPVAQSESRRMAYLKGLAERIGDNALIDEPQDIKELKRVDIISTELWHIVCDRCPRRIVCA